MSLDGPGVGRPMRVIHIMFLQLRVFLSMSKF